MSDDKAKERIKPLFLVKPKSMSRRDIRRAEKEAGIVIVECEEPQTTRLLEPPIDQEIEVQARAALQLMRYVLNNTAGPTTTFYGSNLVKFFVDAMIYQPPPSRVEKVAKK